MGVPVPDSSAPFIHLPSLIFTSNVQPSRSPRANQDTQRGFEEQKNHLPFRPCVAMISRKKKKTN